MKSEYFSFYILSYFDLNRITTVSQILHVFLGKRTPSMFYRIEKNDWHAGFTLNSNIQPEQLETIVKNHVNKEWLISNEKGYQLTNKGLEAREKYFKKHYFPQHIQTFTYANIRPSFWERLQLFSQVFSEMSYQNNSYVPAIKHPHHQENVRNLFQQFSSQKDQLLSQWLKENRLVFQKLDRKKADLLINQLTGHKQIGLTKDQLRKLLQMEPLEFHFYFNDAVEKFIQQVKASESELPLLSTILNVFLEERNFGLSASTNQTFQLLKRGNTINHIAIQRGIKSNTVKEHILEMAFVFERFPYTKFVPSEIYQQLTKKFMGDLNYTYKKAVEDFEQIEFMHFRLVELERMRTHERRDSTSATR